MKWYNVELNQKESILLKSFLNDNFVQYESSGCGDMVHFEIYTSPEIAAAIDCFMDNM